MFESCRDRQLVARSAMTTIITRADSDAIIGSIVELISSSTLRLVRVEGICGSGKTTTSRKLAEKINGVHLELDCFASPREEQRPYIDCLNLDQMDDAIDAAMKSSKVVILDAVCLGEVAPIEKWGRGFTIYVKRLSFNNVDPIWHEGYHLENDPPQIEPHRSVHCYHNRFMPHMNSDLIVEFPEDGHRLPSVPFSRERCFDPPDH